MGTEMLSRFSDRITDVLRNETYQVTLVKHPRFPPYEDNNDAECHRRRAAPDAAHEQEIINISR